MYASREIMCARKFAVQILVLHKKPTHVESLLRLLEIDEHENARSIFSAYNVQNREDASKDGQGDAK